MVQIQLLLLLLLLVHPPYIRGDDSNGIKELKSMVSQLTQIVRAQGENITELHKNGARQEKKIDELLALHQNPKEKTDNPGSCAEIDGGNASGVHNIYPNHESRPIQAWCDNSNDGKWTVIQKRINGSVDFYRGWEEYAEGFGDPAGEYWLGLRHIHALTNAEPMELYIGMLTESGRYIYAEYALFSVSSEEDKFRLSVSYYTGIAGDQLKYHNGQRFTTKDRDNDNSGDNCSRFSRSAWWYKKCGFCDLNTPITQKWLRTIKASTMMIRPSAFRPWIQFCHPGNMFR